MSLMINFICSLPKRIVLLSLNGIVVFICNSFFIPQYVNICNFLIHIISLNILYLCQNILLKNSYVYIYIYTDQYTNVEEFQLTCKAQYNLKRTNQPVMYSPKQLIITLE